MVQVYKHLHLYEEPPQPVLLAFYLRYPNPFARHVLSCDVLSCDINPQTGSVKTQRLILKKGIVPAWARRWLEGLGMMGGGGLEAWVMEESEVWHDPITGQPCLKSMTRNISHKKLMDVREGTELYAAAANGLSGTYHRTKAEIISNFGSGSGLSAIVRNRLEDYGSRRFEGNSARSRMGFSLILSLLRAYQPLPDTEEASSRIPRYRSSSSAPALTSSADAYQRFTAAQAHIASESEIGSKARQWFEAVRGGAALPRATESDPATSFMSTNQEWQWMDTDDRPEGAEDLQDVAGPSSTKRLPPSFFLSESTRDLIRQSEQWQASRRSEQDKREKSTATKRDRTNRDRKVTVADNRIPRTAVLIEEG